MFVAFLQRSGLVAPHANVSMLVGNGLLSQREFLERHRVKSSAGDRHATSAFWNLFRIAASAVSDGIASRPAAEVRGLSGRFLSGRDLS